MSQLRSRPAVSRVPVTALVTALVALLVTALGLAGATPLGAQSLGRPKSEDAAETIRRSNARRAAEAGSSLAIYPFATLLAGDEPERIAARLSGLAHSAFSSPTLRVLDRTTDATLAAEMRRVQSAEEFESAVRVEQGRGTSARYVLFGLLQNARDDTARQKDGRLTHTVALEYRMRVQDVETRQTVLDSVFRVSSADRMLSRGGVAGELRKQVLKTAPKLFDDLLGGERAERRGKDPSNSNSAKARALVGDALVDTTVEEAVDHALEVADKRIQAFAAATTAMVRRMAAQDR